ncbi:MAG: hypothetical protein P4L51_14930 [Puia sp.]|nr:hypothetical protein [Puia sp.]
MKRYHILFPLALALLYWQCNSRVAYPGGVDSSLLEAGSNGKELLKVLKHYSAEPEDSLQFRAACYLIANMKDHFSDSKIGSIPGIAISSYYLLDSLTKKTFYTTGDRKTFDFADFLHTALDSKDFVATPDYVASLISQAFPDTNAIATDRIRTGAFERRVDTVADLLLKNIDTVVQERAIFEDLRSVHAAWLIDHIDNAFRVWKKSPYSRGMGFDEFSQTLLTYRSRNEALDQASGFYPGLFDKILFPGDSMDLSAAIRRLNFYMYCLDCFEDKGRHLGNLGFYDILQFYQYDCDRHSEWTARVLNACGIPAYIDFTSGYFNRDKMHYGVSVRDTAGKYHHFSPKWQPLGDTAHYKLVSKVFRRMYAQQVCPYTLKRADEDIPPIFSDPFIKDVSEEYHTVADISVAIDSAPRNRNLAYLSIFTPHGWRPIGWGSFQQGVNTVKFYKVPVAAVYVAGYFEGGKIIPLSGLFRVDAAGKLSYMGPDHHKTETLTLTMKYPQKEDLIARMKEMDGARIQGANRSDFSDARDLYRLQISDLSDFDVRALPVVDNGKYRFIRCVAAGGKALNIATFEVFASRREAGGYVKCSEPAIKAPASVRRPDTTTLTRVPGIPIENGQRLQNAFDGDLETFVNAFSVGLDLGRPYSIKEIRFAARSANNGIIRGDRYQLLYYDHAWVPLGTVTAKYNFVEFRNVPSGAVYWLRNLDRGKEELSFIYKDGRQFFLNDDEGNAFYK